MRLGPVHRQSITGAKLINLLGTVSLWYPSLKCLMFCWHRVSEPMSSNNWMFLSCLLHDARHTDMADSWSAQLLDWVDDWSFWPRKCVLCASKINVLVLQCKVVFHRYVLNYTCFDVTILFNLRIIHVMFYRSLSFLNEPKPATL